MKDYSDFPTKAIRFFLWCAVLIVLAAVAVLIKRFVP